MWYTGPFLKNKNFEVLENVYMAIISLFFFFFKKKKHKRIRRGYIIRNFGIFIQGLFSTHGYEHILNHSITFQHFILKIQIISHKTNLFLLLLPLSLFFFSFKKKTYNAKVSLCCAVLFTAKKTISFCGNLKTTFNVWIACFYWPIFHY